MYVSRIPKRSQVLARFHIGSEYDLARFHIGSEHDMYVSWFPSSILFVVSFVYFVCSIFSALGIFLVYRYRDFLGIHTYTKTPRVWKPIQTYAKHEFGNSYIFVNKSRLLTKPARDLRPTLTPYLHVSSFSASTIAIGATFAVAMVTAVIAVL